MKNLDSLVVPALIAGWFGIALATLVQLTDMSATLTTVETTEQARQAARQAPRLATVTPRPAAQ